MSTNNSYLISIPGYSISVEEYGDPQGLPVVALHGWLDNSASFFALGDFLKGIRLISMDLVGHGNSSFRPKGMPYHIWDNVTDVEAIISALGLKEVNLVGHSMGASIAALFSGAFPEKVNRLMCIEGLAPLHYEVDQLPNDLSQAISKRKKLASKTLRPYVQIKDAISARMNGRWPVGREAAEALLQKGLVETEGGYCWSHDPGLLLPSLVRFSPEQIRAFLRAITAETTVIKGKDGASYLMDGWIDELQQSELFEFEGGHHLHMEASGAQEIANIINGWVK
ncbi:MAG: alpha/beta fold hydrolase [Neptuniibacter sp.]